MGGIRLKYRIIGGVVFVVILLVFFLSSIVRVWLENNSKEVVGRKISLKELHFNYAKVSVRVKDFAILEPDESDIFVSFKELYINFNPWSLLNKEYSFAEISLVEPYMSVSNNDGSFNFDDLLGTKDTLSVDEVKDTVVTEPSRFTVKNVKISGGEIIYEDKQSNNHIDLNDLNLNIPLISWDSKQSNIGINFRIGEKGEVYLGASVDNQNKRYSVLMKTKSVSLDPVKDYLKDYMNIDYMGGFLTSNVKLDGEMEQVMNISLSGDICIDSLLVNDGDNEELISASRVETIIRNMDVNSFRFDFSTVTITNPMIKAVYNSDMSNFERVMQPYMKNDSLAGVDDKLDTDVSVAESSFKYNIDTLRIINGEIDFTDNTLNRQFNYTLHGLDVEVVGLSESAKEVPVSFFVNTNKRGNVFGNMMLDMTDSYHIDLDMQIRKLGLLSFSPYSEYFVNYPITKGSFNYDLSLKMTPKKLINKNKIRIEKLNMGKKLKNKSIVEAPVKLALYLLKDSKGIIDIDLPVEGNPSDPKFGYTKLLWKTFANFFIKTAAAPFNAFADLVGFDSKDPDKISFEYTQDLLEEKHKKVLSNISRIMQEKPDLIFKFIQFTNRAKEKDSLAVEMAIRDYVSYAGIIDSVQIANLIKDKHSVSKDFMGYLRKRLPQADSLEVSEACLLLIDPDKVQENLDAIIANRNSSLKNYLVDFCKVSPANVEVFTADIDNAPEELKYPHFKIEVTIE